MFRLTENTTIGELLQVCPEIAGVLTGIGMHCLGCPSSQERDFRTGSSCSWLRCRRFDRRFARLYGPDIKSEPDCLNYKPYN